MKKILTLLLFISCLAGYSQQLDQTDWLRVKTKIDYKGSAGSYFTFLDDSVNMNSFRINSLGDAINPYDAVNLHMMQDSIAGIIESGTVAGQMLYWDGSKWMKSDETDLKWDVSGKDLEVDKVTTKEIKAPDGDGLKLFEDAGVGIFIENGGKVGILITDPAGAFHAKLSNTATSSTYFTTIDWAAVTTGTGLSITTGAASGNTYVAMQVLQAGGANVNNLKLQQLGGELHIGSTDNGAYKFQVNGDMIGVGDATFEDPANVTINIDSDTDNSGIALSQILLADDGTDMFRIAKNITNHFEIYHLANTSYILYADADGDVGILTSSPVYPVDINRGDGISNASLRIQDTLWIGGTPVAISLINAGLEIKSEIIIDSLDNLGMAYGELWTAADKVISTADANYRTVTALTTGSTMNVTVDDSIMTIVNGGTYQVSHSESFTHATNTTLVHFSIFVNDVEATNIETERLIRQGTDYGATASSGFLVLGVDDVVKLKVKADNAGNLTIAHLNFNLHLIY